MGKKKTGLLASLKARGFDRSRVVAFERGARVGCSQCEAAVINGVACHETGCPNKARADRERAEREEADDATW